MKCQVGEYLGFLTRKLTFLLPLAQLPAEERFFACKERRYDFNLSVGQGEYEFLHGVT